MADNKRYARDNHCEGNAMAEAHDWHVFDAERGLDVRQITAEGEANVWEVRGLHGMDTPIILNDAEFKQLRDVGPNPKGL